MNGELGNVPGHHIILVDDTPKFAVGSKTERTEARSLHIRGPISVLERNQKRSVYPQSRFRASRIDQANRLIRPIEFAFVSTVDHVEEDEMIIIVWELGDVPLPRLRFSLRPDIGGL